MRNIAHIKKIFQHRLQSGQSLVELVMTIGIAAVVIPALATGFVATRSGRAQQGQRLQAVGLLKQGEAAVRSFRNGDWNTFAVNGTYYPQIVNNQWALTSGTAPVVNGFSTQVVLSDVSRDSNGNIVISGG